MCFNISLARPGEDVSDRFDALFDREIVFDPIFHSSAFDIPSHPVICMDSPHRLKWLSWGLIPRWIGNDMEAEKIRLKTLNARSETIFEKSSFRSAIMENRCLIPVTGFFEFREEMEGSILTTLDLRMVGSFPWRGSMKTGGMDLARKLGPFLSSPLKQTL